MNINEMVRKAHDMAVSKGWHDEPRSFGDLISLIHSELSEALECFRDNRKPTEIWHEPSTVAGIMKPEGVPIEIADVVIRIGDLCGKYGINLESAIEMKMAFNATRSVRHGGKKL